MRATPVLLLLVLGAAAVSAGARPAPAPTLAQLAGAHVLIRMRGPVPGAALLTRIKRGQVGGVVLFSNTIPPEGPLPLVRQLQAAARAGGQPPLLIAIDQEGGGVKRLPGPPTDAPSQMGTAAVAFAQGRATGRYLSRLGIGVDLAPVLDVPLSQYAFIYTRAFSSDPAAVSRNGIAFAKGLANGGVAATAKHFPGLGRLGRSTDYGPGRLSTSRAALAARDLAPFRAAIEAGVPIIMVGTAVYPAYDSVPAATSPAIVSGLLRKTLGFQGVTMSDDLATRGVSPWFHAGEATVRAVGAGIDLVYVAGNGGSGGDTVGEQAYSALLRAVKSGRLSRSALEASYDRIVALRQRYD